MFEHFKIHAHCQYVLVCLNTTTSWVQLYTEQLLHLAPKAFLITSLDKWSIK